MPTNGVYSLPFLVHFYDPIVNAPDRNGRTLISILTWPDSTLESCHDYIQTLFPLPESSVFNEFAPTIDRSTFLAFRSRPDLRARLKESFVRMLHFYGLQLVETGETIFVVRGNDFRRKARNWVARFDHNHLRITRILRSIRVLGLEEEAAAFLRALRDICDKEKRIGNNSLVFWMRAATRPLYLAPEIDVDEGQGADFLYDYEETKSAGGE